MLLKKDLLNSMDSMYSDMLNSVSIPDFTKCIAQFAGVKVQNVPDDVIRDYLVTWAEHKFQFFKLLGNKTKLDMPITYKTIKDDIYGEIKELMREFPGFSPWLDEFSTLRTNKIENFNRDIGYYAKSWIRDLFPQYNIEGNTLTGFFKRKLNAPDELVTALGRIFENDEISGTYTISIDPIDMMLASENPYNWQSCYRLEVPNDASHADGCLAAILDKSSLITYIWDKEGKFNLYNHDLKSVRYKRIREWIAISPDMTAVHFNQIYPGKDAYPEDFRKQLRDKVETVIANYLEIENIWVKDTDSECYRDYGYGYGEFECDKIWKVKGSKKVSWDVYDVGIHCPCGCGSVLPGSDGDDDYDELHYSGAGFCCYNFTEEGYQPYCDLGETYCPYADDICDGNCRGCWGYDNEYPLCNLDNETECENVDRTLVDDGRMHSCSGHCTGCPLWAQHHPNEASTAIEEITIPIENSIITMSTQGEMGVWSYPSTDEITFSACDDISFINLSDDNLHSMYLFPPVNEE